MTTQVMWEKENRDGAHSLGISVRDGAQMGFCLGVSTAVLKGHEENQLMEKGFISIPVCQA